jgi:hypothetical protein
MSWTAIHVHLSSDDERWNMVRSLWRSQHTLGWFVADRIAPNLAEVAWNGGQRPRALAEATVVSNDHAPCVGHPIGGPITQPDEYFDLLALASARAGEALDRGISAEQSSAALWRELVPDRTERRAALHATAAWLERRAAESRIDATTAETAETAPQGSLGYGTQLAARAAHAHYVMLTPRPLPGSERAALWHEARWWHLLAHEEG